MSDSGVSHVTWHGPPDATGSDLMTQEQEPAAPLIGLHRAELCVKPAGVASSAPSSPPRSAPAGLRLAVGPPAVCIPGGRPLNQQTGSRTSWLLRPSPVLFTCMWF